MATVSGKWKFNDAPYINKSKNVRATINFTSNNESYSYIHVGDLTGGGHTYGIGYDGRFVYTGEDDDLRWTEAYRTVDFGDVEQEVSQEFYEWFTANATHLAVTDLTNTTWYVPSGWQAEAGVYFGDAGTIATVNGHTDGYFGVGHYITDHVILQEDCVLLGTRGYFPDTDLLITFHELDPRTPQEPLIAWLATYGIQFQLKVTDLTNTTWHIPSGWQAEAAYGKFSVDCENEYGYGNQFFIGYYFDTTGVGAGNVEAAADKVGIFASDFPLYTPSNTTAFTITFTGGTDTTNPELIAWLSKWGELQTETGADGDTGTENGGENTGGEDTGDGDEPSEDTTPEEPLEPTVTELKDITPISEDERLAMRRQTAFALPDSPAARGMPASAVKPAFWKAFVGKKYSVVEFLNRMAGEINDALKVLRQLLAGKLPNEHNKDDAAHTDLFKAINEALDGKLPNGHNEDDAAHAKLFAPSNLAKLLGLATKEQAGLMSADQAGHLETLVALLKNDDANTTIDTITEVLAAFKNSPEGTNIANALAGKLSTSHDTSFFAHSDIRNQLNGKLGIDHNTDTAAHANIRKDITALDRRVALLESGGKGTKGLSYIAYPDEGYAELEDIGTATGTYIIIADTYEGLPVTSIGAGAFVRCTSLTSITIPSSVTSIGWGAFNSCESLKSITIPAGVTYIYDETFGGCYELSSVYYGGNESDWDNVYIDTMENDALLYFATIYYYSETQPTESGNYWHWVDGEPVIWDV